MKNLKDSSSGFKDLVDSAQKSWLLWGSGKSKAQTKAEAEEKIAKDQKARVTEKGESGNYNQARPDGEPAPVCPVPAT